MKTINMIGVAMSYFILFMAYIAHYTGDLVLGNFAFAFVVVISGLTFAVSLHTGEKSGK